MGEGTGGCQLLADEIAGGDVGDTEELGEAAGVGALPYARGPEEHPLHVPATGIPPPRHPLVCISLRGGQRPDPPPRRRGRQTDGGAGSQQAVQSRHLREERRESSDPCFVLGLGWGVEGLGRTRGWWSG